MKVGALATMVAALLIGFPLASMAGVAADTDNDGVVDVVDNCSQLANAAPLDCDTDNDGYGNACDGDFDNDGSVLGGDFSTIFLPDFGTGVDSGVGTDMDCDGTVLGGDFSAFFLPQFSQGTPGPSGLSCAGTVPCP